MNSIPFLVLALALQVSQACAHSPAAEIAAAANNLLVTLTPEQRGKATFEFASNERVNWHFVPKERKGLPFTDLVPAQKHLAHVVISSALSHRGYFKTVTIMSMEQILFDLENKAPHRNAELYYLSFFGKPGVDVWGLRIEGHHLSLNFTAHGDQILATTPSFLGTNPAEVRTGPRTGLRVLAVEEDLGRKLVTSLDARQFNLALLTNVAPKDIISGASRNATRLEPLGLSAGKMNQAQREMLSALIKEYLGRNRTELADADWMKVETAGWENVHFAWAGAVDPGQGHYYRVQGPGFLLEYDNTQNNANHIHAVWRDLKNDFGDDLLKRHYEQSPHGK